MDIGSWEWKNFHIDPFPLRQADHEEYQLYRKILFAMVEETLQTFTSIEEKIND